MDHSSHTPLTEAELKSEALEGADIHGLEDEKVGSISQVQGSGPGMKCIVDAGGFLGIGTKTVALDASRLNFMRDESGTVHATTDMTKEEVKALPEHQT